MILNSTDKYRKLKKVTLLVLTIIVLVGFGGLIYNDLSQGAASDSHSQDGPSGLTLGQEYRVVTFLLYGNRVFPRD